MSKNLPQIRIFLRLGAVVTVAVVAVTLLAVPRMTVRSAGATTLQEQLQRAKERRQGLHERVKTRQALVVEINQDLAVKTAEAQNAQAALDAVTAELASTREELRIAQHRLAVTQDRLAARAVAAYMQGPASEISLLLDASSFGELSDRMQFTEAIAQADAELAEEIRNTRAELEVARKHLEELQADAREKQAAAEAARDAVVAQLDRQKELLDKITADLAKAERLAKRAGKRYRAWVKRQQNFGYYSGGHAPVPIPSQWRGVLQVCPVGRPYSFAEGFGAPRYAGGYHPHKGVDILSPGGTPIYAPFPGVAYSDYNSLGGNVVFVEGKYGRVYNAHLSAFSDKSNGPVQAGDVIGYVGDTGDAPGIFHDHFEFHPAIMPASWPVSSYGYSIIDDAVNPYPLLVEACG
jgi:murein DD-endopeptidase MepM/ murein hydrolase activator NlpD